MGLVFLFAGGAFLLYELWLNAQKPVPPAPPGPGGVPAPPGVKGVVVASPAIPTGANLTAHLITLATHMIRTVGTYGCNAPNPGDAAAVTQAVTAFQTLASLNVSGVYDTPTAQAAQQVLGGNIAIPIPCDVAAGVHMSSPNASTSAFQAPLSVLRGPGGQG